MTRTRFAAVLLVVGLVSWAGQALAQSRSDTEPAVVVELKFKGDTIEVSSKANKETFVPRQYGVPQLARLFYEATGDDGEVVYSGELVDPREFYDDGNDEASQDLKGSMTRLQEATVRLSIPVVVDAKQLVVYRRDSHDLEKGRTVMLRTGL